MAIFGCGAHYESDMTPEFVEANGVFVGWDEYTSPSLHQMLKSIVVGDLVFIKSFSPMHGLYIKAAGIVSGLNYDVLPNLGHGVRVHWCWADLAHPHHIGKLDDKMDFMRRGTLYQEFSPDVAEVIIRMIATGKP